MLKRSDLVISVRITEEILRQTESFGIGSHQLIGMRLINLLYTLYCIQRHLPLFIGELKLPIGGSQNWENGTKQ